MLGHPRIKTTYERRLRTESDGDNRNVFDLYTYNTLYVTQSELTSGADGLLTVSVVLSAAVVTGTADVTRRLSIRYTEQPASTQPVLCIQRYNVYGDPLFCSVA